MTEYTLDELMKRPLENLLEEAFSIRKENFPKTLNVSTPSPKSYISDYHRNKKNAFVNVSVTGKGCALNCEHCKKSLLGDMTPVAGGGELKELGDRLKEKGCQGVLVSGGALETGEVPLDKFYESLAYLRSIGLKVLVHTGLATRDTAKKLKEAGVNQVLLDVIGAKETISEVYHLDKEPADFLETMKAVTEEGLDLAPHIVIGLHFGKIVGEYKALEMITRINPSTIVLVVLAPVMGTPMEGVDLPTPEDIGKIAAMARILNPRAQLTLGCARPPGLDKEKTERYMIDAGINGIAYPLDETLDYCRSIGLELEFMDVCCSLL